MPSPQAAGPSTPAAEQPAGGEFRLTKQQIAFFDTFGHLKVPGLFRDDIDRMVAGFEEIFANNATWDTNEALHFEQQRRIIPGFVSKSEQLAWIVDDPRTVGVVRSLIGDEYTYTESDGNLFYCDTSWHPDAYAAPLATYHVKLSFYLDPLHGTNGAIRVMPGTNDYESTYSHSLRRDLRDPLAIEQIFGVAPDEIPSWTLPSDPGDLIVWNFRTIHASFNGGERRRLFSLNFREGVTEEEPAAD
jgi:hypothetical protein